MACEVVAQNYWTPEPSPPMVSADWLDAPSYKMTPFQKADAMAPCVYYHPTGSPHSDVSMTPELSEGEQDSQYYSLCTTNCSRTRRP